MNAPFTPLRKRPTTLEVLTNNMMRSNSPTTYSPVESVPLNAFKPNFKPEVPKEFLKVTTPNRPTREPWGKPGALPSNAPPRRSNRSRKTRRRRGTSRRLK
jgi:hypothetical protein